MNDEYICDGEIHALNEKYGYILKYIDSENISETTNFIEMTNEFAKKYCHYLYENDREKVIEILFNHFRPFTGQIQNDFEYIYRPPWVVASMAQKASFALRFKRSNQDNL